MMYLSFQARFFSSEPDYKRARIKKNCTAISTEAVGHCECKDFKKQMERKEHRSGKCQRTEPEGLDIALRDEGVKKAFKDAGC